MAKCPTCDREWLWNVAVQEYMNKPAGSDVFRFADGFLVPGTKWGLNGGGSECWESRCECGHALGIFSEGSVIRCPEWANINWNSSEHLVPGSTRSRSND